MRTLHAPKGPEYSLDNKVCSDRMRMPVREVEE